MKMRRSKVFLWVLLLSLLAGSLLPVHETAYAALKTTQTDVYVQEATADDAGVIRLMSSTKTPSSSETSAAKEFYYLLEHYVDPKFHLDDSIELKKIDKIQKKQLKKFAKGITSGCKNDYAKIKAVSEYIADYLYYDMYYYDNKYEYNNTSATTYFGAYEAYVNQRTVCQGYSALTKTLLNMVGVPCMILYGDNHAFNAAYASNLKRWVVMDVTWCSGNKYTIDGQWVNEKEKSDFFDMTADKLSKITSHEGIRLDGISTGDGFYYTFYMGDLYDKMCDKTLDQTKIDFSKWSDQSKWYCKVTDVKKNTAKAASKIHGHSVKGVYDYAFHNNKKIKSIDLSAVGGMDKIPDQMFYGCKNLKTAKFPKGIKSVGDAAFYDCNKLQTVSFPSNKISKIGEHAFRACRALKQFNFSSDLKSLGATSFYDCISLQKIDLSNTKISAIDEYTFYGCTAAEKAAFPKTLKTVGKYAFYGDSGIKGTLDFSGTKLSEVGYAAFYDLQKVTKIGLPGTLKYVDEFGFGVYGVFVDTDIFGKISSSSLDSVSARNAWINRQLAF